MGTATAVLALCFLLAVILSSSGALERFSSATLLLWGLAPGGVGLCLAAVSARFRGFLRSLSLRGLTLGQTPRILGGSFILWKYAHGILPAAFALTAGLTDIVFALSAVPAAFLLVRQDGRAKPGFYLWHWCSIWSLMLSSLSGILTSNTRFGILHAHPDSQALSHWPLSLIPAFFGPMMLGLELAVLTRAKRVSLQ